MGNRVWRVAPAGVTAEEIAGLLGPLRAAPARSAILCDIDGTLAPITERPDETAVPESARALLRELAGRFALVACVSGRRALEAREIVAVAELHYIGNHGFESVGPGDEAERVDPRISGQADAARDFLAGVEGSVLGAAGLRREDKGPIQSLHWRGASDEERARGAAEELARRAHGQELEARWGRKVLELRPSAPIDKGSAIEPLLAEHRIARALYGGDDVTDLDAFAALRRMRSDGQLEHAVCIGVASAEEPAELRQRSDLVVEGSEGFLELLGRLR